MFEHRLTRIPGCMEILPAVHEDSRGRFVKTYREGRLAQLSMTERYAEHFYTISRKNVLRGLHFQMPPAHHAKLVYCTEGAVLDAVVDLRMDSPTF